MASSRQSMAVARTCSFGWLQTIRTSWRSKSSSVLRTSIWLAEGVLVDRPRYSSGWGPDLLDVMDPNGRLLTIREDQGGCRQE